MARRKNTPLWKKTSITFEKELFIWERMAKGDSNTTIVKWLDQEPEVEDAKGVEYRLDSCSRNTVAEIRKDLYRAPEAIMEERQKEWPEVYEWWRTIREKDGKTGIDSPEEQGIRQHISSVKDSAEKLASELCLPPIERMFISDLNIDYEEGWRKRLLTLDQPGTYRLYATPVSETPEFLVKIQPDGKISLLFSFDIEGTEYNRSAQLASHCATSAYGPLLNQLDTWKRMVGDLLGKCYNLQSEINEYLERLGFGLGIRDTGRPESRIRRGFVTSIAVSAISFFTSNCFSDGKSDHPVYIRENYNLDVSYLFTENWVREKVLIASICEGEFPKLENVFHGTYDKFRSNPIVKSIAESMNVINELGVEISSKLQRFIEEERLPGYCDACRGT